MSMQRLSRLGIGLLLLSTACGTAHAPKELFDARTAYEKSAAGQTGQLTPAQLHEAKLALDQANGAFDSDAAPDKVLDLSYIALAKIQLADTVAGTAAANATKQRAVQDGATLQGEALQKAQAELAKTHEQLTLTGAALETEKKARLEAEKRAKDAMDKLSVAAALAIKEEPRGTVITLPGGVFFTSGKADLAAGAQEKLNAIALALKDQEDRKIIVEGHTDSQGSVDSNKDLSERRAKTVRDYLVSQGVAADKISATGYGESRPVADNKTPEGRANNRRVEIVITPVEKR
jgi:outer membrane protein OmpA-like peptidoglycan-associated protein